MCTLELELCAFLLSPHHLGDVTWCGWGRGQGLWLVLCFHVFLHIVQTGCSRGGLPLWRGSRRGPGQYWIWGGDCLQPGTANPEPAGAWSPEATPLCLDHICRGEANQDGMCYFKTAEKHYRSRVEIHWRAIGMHNSCCFQPLSPPLVCRTLLVDEMSQAGLVLIKGPKKNIREGGL